MSIVVSTHLGIHEDPKFMHYPILYGLGSYVHHKLPDSFKYVYVMFYNNGKEPCTLEHVWAENTKKNQVHHLDISKDFDGTIIEPKGFFLLSFSHHLLCRCLMWGGLSGVQDISFYVRCNNGNTYHAEPLSFDLDNSPANPLEDMELIPYSTFFLERAAKYNHEKKHIIQQHGSLQSYADLHLSWGVTLNKDADGTQFWLLREYMPKADKLWLTTEKLKFQRWAHHAYKPVCEHDQEWQGWWELRLPFDALEHGTYMELRVQGQNSQEAMRRVPATAKWIEQDKAVNTQWCARHWHPAKPYTWKHEPPPKVLFPRIYEAHIGMAQNSQGWDEQNQTPQHVGTFAEFTEHILPYVRDNGYTHVQLMGVLEHPLYKSYGYQVSSYFAPSSRFGHVHDFMQLVDTAHGYGLRIILDIPHSHTLPNTEQGLASYDGSHFFFSDKSNQWGTVSFDYSNEMTRRFLLSNCRYWLEEFKIDGFRFDAVGNMLYNDHGHNDDFNHVGRCFYGKDGSPRADVYGQLYLSIANDLIHEMRPDAESIAEEFSGMPGLTSASTAGGFGFDYRFAMGIPDFWGKFIKDEDKRDMGTLWHEMTNHRNYDHTISYVECHDQCINGKDAMIWRILGDVMYTHMSIFQESWDISRGIALYKLMRMLTLTTAHHGYLNFMGAEFGHPEWLDEDGYGHRQWHLPTDPNLRYAHLAAFDKTCMTEIIHKYIDAFTKQAIFRHIHEENKTLAFERGPLLMAYNFHELQSQSELKIPVTPGKYIEILSTDRIIFGGHGNVDAHGTEHFSAATSGIDLQNIELYLPPMTAIILLRQ